MKKHLVTFLKKKTLRWLLCIARYVFYSTDEIFVHFRGEKRDLVDNDVFTCRCVLN